MTDLTVITDARPLSAREADRLQELEAVVVTNFKAFYEVGAALAEIRREELYRASHITFAEYCKDVFDVAKSRAYQLIEAAGVVDVLMSTNGGHSMLPANERQARLIADLPEGKQGAVWRLTTETAPNGKISTSHIKKSISEFTGKPIDEKVKEVKKEIRKSEQISKEFAIAFDAFLDQIQKAKDSNWQTTSKIVVTRHIESLLSAIEA